MHFKSEGERQAAIEHIAQSLWDAREQTTWGDDPKWQRYRQTWAQGTDLAKSIMRSQACALLLDRRLEISPCQRVSAPI